MPLSWSFPADLICLFLLGSISAVSSFLTPLLALGSCPTATPSGPPGALQPGVLAHRVPSPRPAQPQSRPTASSAVSRACVAAGGTHLPPVVRATKICPRGKALGGCGTCSRLAGGQNKGVPSKKAPSFPHQYGMPEKRSLGG